MRSYKIGCILTGLGVAINTTYKVFNVDKLYHDITQNEVVFNHGQARIRDQTSTIILAFSRSRITLYFHFMCFNHVALVWENTVCFESSKAYVTFHKSQAFVLMQFEHCFTLAHICEISRIRDQTGRIILAFSRSRIMLYFYFMCLIHVALVGEKTVCFKSS